MITDLTVGKKLGEGCFGEVLKGHHQIHGEVAVKRLKQAPSESRSAFEARKRDILKEGKRLKDAEHENVVRVLDVVEDPSTKNLLLVTELCTEGSLEGIYEHRPMRLSRLREVLSDAAIGLQVIHDRGFVHRDIKPGNILLDASDTAKVSDFGLVTDEIIKGYASKAGYLDHLAYETHQDGVTSTKTDIWAFGMTTYRLMNGSCFYEEQSLSPRHEISKGGFAKKLRFLPHIPDKWRRFVRKAMHDDSSKRYQSFHEVADALGKLPFTPDWNVAYTGNTATWEITRQARCIKVEWTQHSPRKHEWSAISYPTAKNGRKYTLAKSKGIVGKRDARKNLRSYFDGYE
jgi:serine/threonine protein kinase